MKKRHTTAQGLGKISSASPQRGAECRCSRLN